MALKLMVGYQISLGVRVFHRSEGRPTSSNFTKLVSQAANGELGEVEPAAGSVVTWASSDAAKATVSSKGIVAALAAGTTTITATLGSTTATLEVEVTAADPGQSMVVVPEAVAPVKTISYTPGAYDSNDD